MCVSVGVLSVDFVNTNKISSILIIIIIIIIINVYWHNNNITMFMYNRKQNYQCRAPSN